MSANLFEMNQLRYFVAVAECLNFRQAARRLHMTQPPLSRHIKLLEHALGVKLFDRTNRSVKLTPAGERFLFDAIDILKRAESAALFAGQAERGEIGNVLLGFVPSASLEVVPRIAARLRAELPGIKLSLLEMMTLEMIEGLSAGSLDIGLIRLPNRQPALTTRRIWSEPFVLAVPKDHAFATKANLSIMDVHNVDFVGFSTERGGFLYETVTGYLNSIGVTPNVTYEVAQSHTIMSLVDAGNGVGLVPRSNAAICMQNTVIREIELPDVLRSDLYIALGSRANNPLIAHAAKVIEQEFDAKED